MNCALPCAASTFVIAAVSVVLPWSTCPIVPTFTCGLFRSNFSFDMTVSCSESRTLPRGGGALGLADDRLGDAVRHLGVVAELHRVRGAALRLGAQVGRVAEHLRERNLGGDD